MSKVTRTTNPLPFEALEPHRFEDIVRGLLYDFRDWQIIEPTGKGGNDDGYDARAWEKVKVIENEDEDTKEKGQHPMEGNRWMIQCKREKVITPKEIEKILKTVDPKDPPHGYILAAPANFSKTSHDKFREILIQNGVQEFELWGKQHLEDLLYLPKNDHVLFTAFGFSLNTKRRSRKADVKFALNSKNKIFKICGKPQPYNENSLNHEPVLIRDFNDEFYPFKNEYKDFKKNRRWLECVPFRYHPLGLWVKVSERYAYFDKHKKEFGFYKEIDLLHRIGDRQDTKKTEKNKDLDEKFSDFWERLPIKNQAKLEVEGLIYFKDMLVIDDKGDSKYPFPHIFVEFHRSEDRLTPFDGYSYLLKTENAHLYLDPEEYKLTNIFPKEPPEPVFKTIRKTISDIPYNSFNFYDGNKVGKSRYLFDLQNKYSSFKKDDVISIPNETSQSSSYPQEDNYIQITQVYKITIKDFLEENGNYYEGTIKMQNIGLEFNETDQVTIYEVRPVYKWQFEKLKTKTSK